MKLNYHRHGDYLLPDLGLSEEDGRPIGKYGHMRLEYLQKEHPGLYARLLLSGELMPHLHEVDQTCRDRFDLIMQQMKVTEGVTEQLKAEDQLEWVRRMNSIHNRIEEILLDELILC